MRRLAKGGRGIYIKREPRLLLAGRNRGWHGAVCAPVHGYHRRTIFYDPDPPHMGRGQLLSDGGRQQQDKGHCDE